MDPFSLAYHDACPFGPLAAVQLPEGLAPVPDEVLGRLLPDEAAHARTLRGRRRIEWVGGRLALRAAAEAHGIELPAVLTGARGEPLLPRGLAASISHKRTLAVALIGGGEATVGIDVEELAPARPAIARRVLRPEELDAVERLPPEERWPATVTRFAIKEAVYKAIHPHLRRYVAFEEALVELPAGAEPRVRLLLAGGARFRAEAWSDRRGGMLRAAVRIAPA